MDGYNMTPADMRAVTDGNRDYDGLGMGGGWMWIIVLFLFLFGFMVVIFSMTSGSVDNVLMKVCSYIPFTSPMAMFIRIAMSTVPWYEIAISIGLLVASTFGIGVLSAKIYRVGVLMYGTSPKIGNIINLLDK